MEEIPQDINNDRLINPKWPLSIVIIGGMILALCLTGPTIYQWYLSKNSSTVPNNFSYIGYDLNSINNETNSIVMQYDFQYTNLYSTGFTYELNNCSLHIQNNSNSLWQTIGPLYQNQTYRAEINHDSSFSLLMNVSNLDIDWSKRMFLSQLITKTNFTVSFIGNLNIIQHDNSSMPNEIPMNITDQSKILFNFEQSEYGPSIFTVNDIHTPGIDPTHPSDYFFGLTMYYNNSFNFPINWISVSGNLVNRTMDGEIGQLNLDSSDLGLFAPNTYKNVSIYYFVQLAQVGWTMSDLLSNIYDIVKLENVSITAQIGPVNLTFYRENETEYAPIEFPVDIPNISVDGSTIYVDLSINNPCDVVMNFTHLQIQLLLSGTAQVVMNSNQDVNMTMDRYGTTTAKHLKVTTDYAMYLTHQHSLYDLIGSVAANSFNFLGTIPFEMRNMQF